MNAGGRYGQACSAPGAGQQVACVGRQSDLVRVRGYYTRGVASLAPAACQLSPQAKALDMYVHGRLLRLLAVSAVWIRGHGYEMHDSGGGMNVGCHWQPLCSVAVLARPAPGAGVPCGHQACPVATPSHPCYQPSKLSVQGHTWGVGGVGGG
jgi:hypothetical protein